MKKQTGTSDNRPEIAPAGMSYQIFDDSGRVAVQFRHKAEAEAFAGKLGAQVFYRAQVDRPFTDGKWSL